MPELPEVHTIVSQLKPKIVGAKFVSVGVLKEYKMLADHKAFIKTVKNTTVTDVKRIAKNILIELDNGKNVHIHLAMTGRILYFEKKPDAIKWPKIRFELEKNDKNIWVYFADMISYGKVAVIDASSVEKLSKRYPPESLGGKYSHLDFHEKIKNKKLPIKVLLLDQAIMTGLGNIYVNEVLFESKIHPMSLGKNLSINDSKIILKNAEKILDEAILHRGSTLKDAMFIDIFGKPGTQQDYFRVFYKEICIKCGNKIEYTKIAGRGTYFCPNCQILR